MRILVMADSDLDGVGTAAMIKWYYNNCSAWYRPRAMVEVMFPTRSGFNGIFWSRDRVRRLSSGFDFVFICDLGLDSSQANQILAEELASKTIYIDHHPTTDVHQSQYKERYFMYAVEAEGGHCTAEIAYCLLVNSPAAQPDGPFFRLSTSKRTQFTQLHAFATLVTDLDLWYRKLPRSMELGDFVETAGPHRAFAELMKILPDFEKNTPTMEKYLEQAETKKQNSKALGEATLVQHDGYKMPFSTCFVDDYASWVGSELVDSVGLIAMMDVKGKTLHFRVGPRFVGTAWNKAKGTKPDSLDFAVPLGGGGHHQSAGVSEQEALPIFKELSRRFGEVLLEEYNNDRDNGSG